MPTEATAETRKSPKWFIGLLVFAGLYGGWVGISLNYVIPWLWGPYAELFGDAGPLVVTRGGAIVTVGLLPFVVRALIALLAQREFLRIAVLTICTGAAFVGYGYYLHHIVHFQGVGKSELFWRAEVGLPADAPTPARVLQAFALSDELASEGNAPWLPRQWTRVSWPGLLKP